ncbi:MAG: DUF937 domain-containing protein [Roseomonas sp.]|nr:DUF937 domain-containing protein [Roseomonas sp.]
MSNPWGQSAGGGLGDLLGAMMGGGSADGLASLVGKLQKGGLGAEVESWVGSGENISVAPEKLTQALGRDELAGWRSNSAAARLRAAPWQLSLRSFCPQ